MKKLYLSDVDGTLTRGTPFPTEYTIETLRELIKEGLNFTIATGRSLASVVDFYTEMEGILPVVTLNGALVYDINKGKAINVFGINKNVLPSIFDIFKKENKECRTFVFNWEKQQVINFRPMPVSFPYSKKVNPSTGLQYEDVVIVDDVPSMAKYGDVMYIGYSGPKAVVTRIYEAVSKLEGVQCTFQSDPYNEDNFYIDIFSNQAGKSAGVKVVAEYMGAEEVITFGDNGNDICMLENADRSYAVSNASQAVKSSAKFVLEDAGQNCIADFIKDEWIHRKQQARAVVAR